MRIRNAVAGVGVAAVLGCGVLLAPAASADTTTPTTATLNVSSTGFSPNGDGKQDTITFGYNIPTSSVVALQFLDSKGAVLGQKTLSGTGSSLLGLPVAAEPAGAGSYTWDGSLDAGLPISGNKDIKARLVALDSNSLLSCLGTSLGGVVGGGSSLDLSNLDLSNPDLQCANEVQSGDVPVSVVANPPALSLTTSQGSVFPVRDGYRDSVKLVAKAADAASTSFTLSRPNGDVVRKWTGSDSGWSTSWNGSDSTGKTLKAGFYKLTGTAVGQYGNASTVKSVNVRVSGKEFEMKNGEWKLKL